MATRALDFLPSRRRPSRTPTEPRVIAHLRRLLDQVDAMSDTERDAISAVAWVPPSALLRDLLDCSLTQRDRVEMIIIAYKRGNWGQSPSWDAVGKVLDISHQNARHYGYQLIALGRAKTVAGQFRLCEVDVQVRQLKLADF